MSALRWTKVDAYHLRSQCGRYRVTKYAQTDRTHYAAWHRPPTGEAELLGVYEHAWSAQERAAVHAEGSR